MACTCTQNTTECNPCPTCTPPDAACECLPSALENFTKEFFGVVTKSVVDGAVVWALPCDLAVGLENNPRLDGEGLACYFLRLFGEGITGLTGPTGPQGPAGTPGANAYVTLTSDFLQPDSTCPATTFQVSDPAPFSAGAKIWVTGSGYYEVLGVSGSTLFVQLISSSVALNTPIFAGARIYITGPAGSNGSQGLQGPAGPQGDPGPTGPQGSAGPSATTTCLTTFNQPAPGSNTAALVFSVEDLIAVGQTVFLQTGGYYEVVSVGGGVVLKNLYDEPANAAAGALVNASGSELAIVGGARGRGAYTYLTANYVQPAVGATVAVSVADTTIFSADTYVTVASGGVYYIVSIASGTQMTLRNLGSLGAAAPAAVVTAGVKLTPSAATSPSFLTVFGYAVGPVALTNQGVTLVNAAAGPIAVNLPAAVSSNGIVFIVKKVDATANAVTITAAGADTIDGSGTQPITVQYDSLSVVSDGVSWHII
jgi:hypothetical protein